MLTLYTNTNAVSTSNFPNLTCYLLAQKVALSRISRWANMLTINTNTNAASNSNYLIF